MNFRHSRFTAKFFIFLAVLFFLTGTFFAIKNVKKQNELNSIFAEKISGLVEEKKLPDEPVQLEIFRKSYPDVFFESFYDEEKNDWLVKISAPIFPGKEEKKQTELWWAECRLLPEDELENKNEYWKLIYQYSKLKDPKEMNAEEIEEVRNFSSSKNRQTSQGTPMFFFDFLYAAKSKVIIEDHIAYSTFLGKPTKIHERIKTPLLNVEKRILKLADDDPEIDGFVKNLKSADAYNWRVIEGTGGRKSFHSYGIAVDLIPKRLYGKAIFWSWTRDKDPKNWMLTPLEKRWMPPQKVIDIFEDEGFIWGGNWIIFDNMHFEYHPEILTGM